MVKNKRKFSSMRDKGRDDAKNRESRGGGSGTLNLPEGVDVSFFKPEKGNHLLDLIPYVTTNNPERDKGELHYKRTIWVHFNVGPESKSFLCRKTHGSDKRCPICEEHIKLRKDSSADEDEVKGLKAKERNLFNVIDLNDEDTVIQLWEISYHNFAKLLDEEINASDDPGFFADLEGGSSVSVRFKDTQIGNGPTFIQASKIDFKDRDDLDEDILDNVFDLDGILKVLSYDELEKAHLGEEEDSENDNKDDSNQDDPPTDESSAGTDEPTTDGCPEGGNWGKDFDEWQECDECDVKEACEDENGRLKKAANKSSNRSARNKPTKKGK